MTPRMCYPAYLTVIYADVGGSMRRPSPISSVMSGHELVIHVIRGSGDLTGSWVRPVEGGYLTRGTATTTAVRDPYYQRIIRGGVIGGIAHELTHASRVPSD